MIIFAHIDVLGGTLFPQMKTVDIVMSQHLRYQQK